MTTSSHIDLRMVLIGINIVLQTTRFFMIGLPQEMRRSFMTLKSPLGLLLVNSSLVIEILIDGAVSISVSTKI
ncbi:hypothetical protein BDZ45DRAFT_682400 [Acephala macrosclerotiorum]|nr:hypothetical protein BDZ45DRAFT_682400 [Acephala macrosclerotiorum]